MDRVTSLHYCLGALGVLLLQGLLCVEGRSIINTGLELVNKLSQLEKALREDLDLERKITADVMAEVKSLPGKRGELLCLRATVATRDKNPGDSDSTGEVGRLRRWLHWRVS
ncbi:hypothetical protein N1851_018483 [Merluccius polli]|uniref:Uncharacterized protein n=1 Tax=Merluccius polli TaxID=89951 RepID=A0AA47P0D5_MERPO|nr:hypothetical protein N1851_018483 [Merluccius polli]